MSKSFVELNVGCLQHRCDLVLAMQTLGIVASSNEGALNEDTRNRTTTSQTLQHILNQISIVFNLVQLDDIVELRVNSITTDKDQFCLSGRRSLTPEPSKVLTLNMDTNSC